MHSPVSGNSWLIKGGRIIDPARKIDRIDDLAVRDGVIAESVGETEVRVLDAEGLIVAPGLIDTEMTAAYEGERKDSVVKRIPLGRSGEAAEVAALIAFLASDKASYITGQVVNITGGLQL